MSESDNQFHNISVTGGYANTRKGKRAENDYYATPPEAIQLLLNEGEEFHNVWENAVGGGHLADVLWKENILSRVSDIVDRGYPMTETIDFLEYDNPNSWDGDMVTNPPYKFLNQWIEKSLETIKEGRRVALFLPIRCLEGKTRRKIFDKYPLEKVYISSSRLEVGANGIFKRQGSAVAYGWFIWKKGNTESTILKWFN